MKVNTKHGKKNPAVEVILPLYCPKTAILGGKIRKTSSSKWPSVNQITTHEATFIYLGW